MKKQGTFKYDICNKVYTSYKSLWIPIRNFIQQLFRNLLKLLKKVLKTF